MGSIFNSSEEITKTAEYPNIKLFRTAHTTASEPQVDLDTPWITWGSTSEENLVKTFSAICLLTIRNMADVLGKNKVRKL